MENADFVDMTTSPCLGDYPCGLCRIAMKRSLSNLSGTDGPMSAVARLAAARMLGYDDPAELLGKNMHSLEHHTRKDGTPYPIEECPIYWLPKKRGRP